MCIQVKCAPEFQNDSWQKNYFYFSRIISSNHCMFIHHWSHLKPFLSYFPYIVYNTQGIFQYHFQYKKVHTILHKIRHPKYDLYWYVDEEKSFITLAPSNDAMSVCLRNVPRIFLYFCVQLGLLKNVCLVLL